MARHGLETHATLTETPATSGSTRADPPHLPAVPAIPPAPAIGPIPAQKVVFPALLGKSAQSFYHSTRICDPSSAWRPSAPSPKGCARWSSPAVAASSLARSDG